MVSEALCLRRKAEDRWTLDKLASSHIHTHTGHPAGAQRTKQPNPTSEPKRQAACSVAGGLHQDWQAQLTFQGAGVGLHPHGQLSQSPAPCLTAVPPNKGGPINTHCDRCCPSFHGRPRTA